jgi:hypothetical protein
MDLLYRGHVHGFGIMSSDSDFMPLAMRIRQDGVPVYGFGTEKTPVSFKEACTRFIDVSALVSRGATETPAEAETRPTVQVDRALRKLLRDAIDASKQDDNGFASLSEVGQRAGNRSSFDARTYGYSRLSDLIAAIPEFQVERREAGVFVRSVA